MSLFLLFNHVLQIKDLLLAVLCGCFLIVECFRHSLELIFGLFLQSIHFLNITLKCQNSFLSLVALLFRIVEFISSIFKFPRQFLEGLVHLLLISGELRQFLLLFLDDLVLFHAFVDGVVQLVLEALDFLHQSLVLELRGIQLGTKG